MSVMFTSEAERKRVENRAKPTWGLLTTVSIVEAVHYARDNGWKENKVQVRYEKIDDNSEIYYVEPYEKGCGCKGILKYKNYFD